MRGRWAPVLALSLWAGACASTAAPARAPVPTLPQTFPSGGGSIIEVRLVYDAALDCLLVEYNDNRLPARWPFGYAWTRDHGGVRSPDGKHVARIDELTRVIGIRGQFETLTVPEFGAGTTTPPPANAACDASGDTLLISDIL